MKALWQLDRLEEEGISEKQNDVCRGTGVWRTRCVQRRVRSSMWLGQVWWKMQDEVKLKKPQGLCHEGSPFTCRQKDPHCGRWPWRWCGTRRFGYLLLYAPFCLAHNSNCCDYHTLPAIGRVLCALEDLELQEGQKYLDSPEFKSYLLNVLSVLGPVI